MTITNFVLVIIIILLLLSIWGRSQVHERNINSLNRECAYNQELLRVTRNNIRRHRDLRGDNRCWLDDEELYATLPEGYKPPCRDAAVEIENCQRFIRCRHNPSTTYYSPQDEIDRLQAIIDVRTAMDARVAQQLHNRYLEDVKAGRVKPYVPPTT